MRTLRHRHLATAGRATSTRSLSQIGGVVAVAAIFVVSISLTASAATFTVNTTSDTDDGVCDSAHCSLREAMTLANASPGTDLIAFDIPGPNPHTIQPSSPLPELTDPVTIDATTQPGYSDTPVIELDGTNAGLNTTGLHLTGGDSLIRGLVINRFGGTAIHIENGGSNTLQSNLINSNLGGTDFADGVMFLFDPGVLIENSSSNVIGGTPAAQRNLLAGDPAVVISGTISEGNVIQGNYVGTDVSGSRLLDADGNSNLAGGILIDGAPRNLIGGEVGGAGNLLTHGAIGVFQTAGFVGSVRIQGGAASANVVQGNLIGTDAAGLQVIETGGHGVLVDNAPETVIGGTTEAARNLISGPDVGVLVYGPTAAGTVIRGNYFGTDIDGVRDISSVHGSGSGIGIVDAPGTLIGGGANAGNLISAWTVGITIGEEGSVSTIIQGNMIGTDVDGKVDLGNTIGIWILQGVSDVTIGGPDDDQRNVISGNDFGIYSWARNLRVENNYIGTDISGELPLGNAAKGLLLQPPVENNVIVDNVISANGTGLTFFAGGPGGCNIGNVIQGNFVGTNPSGTRVVDSQLIGLELLDVQDLLVGGTTAMTRNVISGNNTGIRLQSCADNPIRVGQIPSEDVRIVGNYIGTDVSGTTVLSNTGPGVNLGGTFGAGTVVGGTEPGAGNVISGNGTGIDLFHTGIGAAAGVPIKGNLIGTDATGMVALGNDGFGIS